MGTDKLVSTWQNCFHCGTNTKHPRRSVPRVTPLGATQAELSAPRRRPLARYRPSSPPLEWPPDPRGAICSLVRLFRQLRTPAGDLLPPRLAREVGCSTRGPPAAPAGWCARRRPGLRPRRRLRPGGSRRPPAALATAARTGRPGGATSAAAPVPPSGKPDLPPVPSACGRCLGLAPSGL